MAKFVINGGKKLSGEIRVNGAKNNALKIIAASLLSDEEMIINNVPDIEDVRRLLELLTDLGAVVKTDGNTVTISTKNVNSYQPNPKLVVKLRASTMLMGPLLARFGNVFMPFPGGCALGRRPIDLFLDGFKVLGADVEETEDGYWIKAEKLQGSKFVFPFITVTGTESLILTAVLTPGKTIIKNAACEPEILALAEYLNQQGAKITGAGTHTIEIEGVEKLSAGTYNVIPDRIEAGSFAIMGVATDSPIKITNCNPDHLESLLVALHKVGGNFEIGPDWIQLQPRDKTLRPYDMKTHEYPGFATDLQQPFTVLLTQTPGTSLIHETIFEGRFFYIDML
ncbi:MAG TPA: UDP-N-acetylglucosamine 1-carboxyvinyltransferase, partial [Patescibacteria group bacterium]